MTHSRLLTIAAILCLSVSGCAGGNAIEQGVPSAALAPNASAAFPPPVEPGSPFENNAVAPAPSLTNTAPAAPPVTASSDDVLPTGIAANTGTFPDAATQQQGETTQISDEERDAMMAELLALQQQQQGNTVSSAAYRARLLELQRLAQTHSRDTIRTIEAQ